MKPPRFHFGLPLRAAGIWANLEATASPTWSAPGSTWRS